MRLNCLFNRIYADTASASIASGKAVRGLLLERSTGFAVSGS